RDMPEDAKEVLREKLTNVIGKNRQLLILFDALVGQSARLHSASRWLLSWPAVGSRLASILASRWLPASLFRYSSCSEDRPSVALSASHVAWRASQFSTFLTAQHHRLDTNLTLCALAPRLRPPAQPQHD
ncbi:hypothetical protein THAOC_08683, partial [Thalassiosira oceanica]